VVCDVKHAGRAAALAEIVDVFNNVIEVADDEFSLLAGARIRSLDCVMKISGSSKEFIAKAPGPSGSSASNKVSQSSGMMMTLFPAQPGKLTSQEVIWD